MKTKTTLAALGLVALAGLYLATPSAAQGKASDDLGSSQAHMNNPQGEARFDASAATSTLEAEWCPGVASTTLPASKYLVGAKSLRVDNRSSATCYASFDAGAATTTGARGLKFAAGTDRSIDLSGTTFGPNIRAACTAATTTGACMWFWWLK